jgi:hypothetical protein
MKTNSTHHNNSDSIPAHTDSAGSVDNHAVRTPRSIDKEIGHRQMNDSSSHPTLSEISNKIDIFMKNSELKHNQLLLTFNSFTTIMDEFNNRLKCMDDLINNVISNKMDDILAKNIVLSERVSELETKLSDLQADQKRSSPNISTLCQELDERERRKRNVIICHLEENPDRTYSEGQREDAIVVANLLRPLDPAIDVSKIKCFRLGKYNGNNRPIKVILNSEEQAKNILKNKLHVRPNNVKIFGDQTIMQRDCYRELKQELNDRRARGETDISIKFIKGVPKIFRNYNAKN